MLLISQKIQAQSCPDSPIIVGSTSLCQAKGSYEIINYNATFSASYQFQFFPGTSGALASFNTGTGEFEVNWTSLTQCSLVVSLAAPCQGADTIFMQNCCDIGGVAGTLIDPTENALPGVNVNGEFIVTGQTINIEGTLKVNAPLLLINCIVNMGPGARIDVYKNTVIGSGAIALTGSMIRARAACNTMWEGIRMFNNAQIKTEIGNFVTISGAQNAIAFYGNVGYHFQAPETRLWNNFRGILVKPRYNSNIILTKLASSGGLFISGGNAFGPIPLPQNYVNGQLPLPINNTSYLGIDMLNCDQFEVDGSFGQSRNIITFLSYGIRLFDSNISVNETDFENIIANPNYVFYGSGSAVFANRISTTNNNTINFPSAANASLTNTIENCTHGINIIGSYHLNAKGNSFTNINQFGIRVRGAINNSNLTISNSNNFNNCNVGVSLENCTNANAIINSNIFTSTLPFGNSSYANTAIYISNASQVSMNWQIMYNTISGYRLGIYSNNSRKGSLGFNPIRYNQILFNQSVPRPAPNDQLNFMGIWLDNIQNINLSNNTIDYNQATITQNFAGRLRGLNIKDTRVGTVSNNEISNMGISMRFVGLNIPITLQCNIMDACQNGIFLNNAAIMNQGTQTSPWDNQWRNFGTNRRVYGALVGGPSFVDWYYKSSSPDFSPLNLVPILWLFPHVTNFPSPCDDAIDPGDVDPEIMIDFLRAIVADSITLPSDSLDYLFRLQLFAYATLEENDSIRELLPEFMNFYAEQLSSTLSRLVNAERAIEELDYTTATIYLNAATCMETASLIMQKTLNAIREYDLMGNGSVDDMSFELRDDLEAIAYLPSSIYGTGVFYARAILNLEVDDVNIGLRIRNEELNIQKNNSPRCFDNLGRQMSCPDQLDNKVIKKKTKSGDFIILK